MTITIYDNEHPIPPGLSDDVVEFLHHHLGRYGDPRDEISLAIGHALGENSPPGGFVCLATDAETITGAVVINRTGMTRYIPENQLVYIAVDERLRGQGIGRQLLNEVIARAHGGIALHVEADNPALHLYESLGFSNKYLEMRLVRKEDI